GRIYLSPKIGGGRDGLARQDAFCLPHFRGRVHGSGVAAETKPVPMNPFRPGYVLFVGASVLLALAFPVARHIPRERLRQQYYFLQGITLVGAVVGAKFSVLVGDYHWPWATISDWGTVLWSGRSITGALLFGFLFAELAKPLMGYTMPP